LLDLEHEIASTAPEPAPVDAPRLPLDAWIARASRLELDTLEIDVVARRTLELREPLNSVVRGLLGARLRDLRCITRAPTCEGCAEASRCDYARVFETAAEHAPGAHGSHGLHPYWLRGVPAVRDLPEGVKLRVRLAAAGFARPVLPYLDVALRDAWARLGAGALVLSASRSARMSVPIFRSDASSWLIEAMTPLVLGGDPAKARVDCPTAPWLALLVRAGVRRVSALLAAYAPEVERASVEIPDLRGIELIEGGFSEWSDSRYSARQGKRVPLGGWVGRMEVRGEAMATLSPLLSALGVLNVGKGTAMGFGDVRMDGRTA
jgi:hypothetical protein